MSTDVDDAFALEDEVTFSVPAEHLSVVRAIFDTPPGAISVRGACHLLATTGRRSTLHIYFDALGRPATERIVCRVCQRGEVKVRYAPKRWLPDETGILRKHEHWRPQWRPADETSTLVQKNGWDRIESTFAKISWTARYGAPNVIKLRLDYVVPIAPSSGEPGGPAFWDVELEALNASVDVGAAVVAVENATGVPLRTFGAATSKQHRWPIGGDGAILRSTESLSRFVAAGIRSAERSLLAVPHV
jgi:hypothetical protein